MKRAVKHIHFVGTPGAGARRTDECSPSPTKQFAKWWGCEVKHAVKPIHFVGTPGAGPRRTHESSPRPTKQFAKWWGAK